MGHGGARKGAGKPKGVKWPSTLAKAEARELVRCLVTEELQPLVKAQIGNALGVKYLVTRDKKTGKFIRVGEAMAKVKSEDPDNEETIEVWEKDPSVQAFTDLLNRALDKPIEHQEHSGPEGGPIPIADILQGRHRRHSKKVDNP